MNRSTLTGTLGGLIAVVSIGAAIGAAVLGRPEGPPAVPVPPCAAEDGGPYPCVWDGPNRGNHTGDRVLITVRP